MKQRKLWYAVVCGMLALLLAMPALAQEAVPGETDLSVPGDGREIPVSVVLPEGEGPFPLVVICHGHGGSRQENGGFSGIAQALLAQGIASIRMDFPGCGDSTAPFSENNLTNMIADVNASTQYMLDNYPIDDTRVGILGYSMGGRIALSIVAGEENPFVTVGLLAPATFPYDTESARAEYEIALAEGSYMQPWYGGELELTPQWFEDLFNSDLLMASLPKLTDAIVVYGDADDVVPPASCIACAEQIGAELVEVVGADHGYGFYSDQPEVTEAVEGAFANFFSDVFM